MMSPRTYASPASDVTPIREQTSRALTQRRGISSISLTRDFKSGISISKLRGAQIIGLTPAGRTTVSVLMMNEVRRVQLRAALITRGEF